MECNRHISYKRSMVLTPNHFQSDPDLYILCQDSVCPCRCLPSNKTFCMLGVIHSIKVTQHLPLATLQGLNVKRLVSLRLLLSLCSPRQAPCDRTHEQCLAVISEPYCPVTRS